MSQESDKLLIAFRLDESKRKNFESEFPILGTEESFRQVEEIVNKETSSEEEK